MFLAIIRPFPAGIAAKGDKVCDNKLRWCGVKRGRPGPNRPPEVVALGYNPEGTLEPGGPLSPRFTGRPNWLANKGTEIPGLLLVDGGGTLGRGMVPRGAAPGGKSFGLAPWGKGLRC